MIFEIKTNSGEYVVKVKSYGFTGAICCIYETKSFNVFGFKFKLNKKVWEGRSVKIKSDVNSAKPDWLYNWFEYSVAEYEDYKKAWDDWSENK